ncbi:hypothetical protein FNV43_RR17546 [Rhamnella rubrinervis]|uniref:Glycosyltransferase n=1 Tax=Rhamnella rubrinervis TaxID=2594499 RepID=A0A8K0GXW5_9ROSA|nr:hypothetical protein FNV43_RR17546 [Rhamnella rubrinervis]
MKKAELVFVPFPFWSHLTPTIEFAKLLVSHDDRLHITMLISRVPFDATFVAYIDSLVASSPMSDCIDFVSLPCDYVFAPETNHNVAMTLLMDHQKTHVKNAVTKLIQAHGDKSPRLAGFVVDQLCSAMVDVANGFRVPTYVFFTVSAGFVSLMFHLQTLRDEEFAELTNSPDAELQLPSFVNSVPARILPEAVLDKAASQLFLNNYRKVRDQAKGIIVNTFFELESGAIQFLSDDKFPTVYPVGPAVKLIVGGDDDLVGSRGNNQKSEIIAWLDDQPASSVVFLCFGNVGSFGDCQLKEIARALESSGMRFLWSLRKRPSSGQDVLPSGYTDFTEVLDKEFFDRTAAIGKIIGWAPQVAILAHPAIGGFVSHCGWNSVLESLRLGVPIATWPLYAEQQFNAFELVKELGVAVEIKLDYVMDFKSEKDPTVVSAQVMEATIRRLLEHDSDVRKRVKDISEKSKKALMDGGSSHTVLNGLINDVIDSMP